MEVKIGNVVVKEPSVLAPLAGITDSAFRTICRKMGAAFVCSEMISADGIINGNTKTLRYIFFSDEERPISIQIFGESPEIMARASNYINRLNPDIIDINFGCPQKKVTKKGAGAALLRDIKKMEKITRAVVNEVDLPVTAKIRSGWSADCIVAVDVAQSLENAGVKAITVHPRTCSMGFSGKPDWNIIKMVRKNINIPVIGNGDIDTPEKAKKMLDSTGCDLIMIGRGSLGTPWIFKEVNFFIINGYKLPEVKSTEKIDFCIEHLKLSITKKGEYYGIREMRKHIGWYTKGLPFSTEIRREIVKLDSPENVIKKLIEYKSILNNYLD